MYRRIDLDRHYPVTRRVGHAAGIDAETRVLPSRPEAELGKLVDEEGYGMVVMGAGHSRIRSLVIGSTTTEMVQSCKVPVVLMR